MSNQVINIDEPRYDQSTYIGRAKHFFVTTNPLNILASDKELENAKDIVESFRKSKSLPSNVTVDQLWQAKYLSKNFIF
jgi:sideroflexin-1/3